MDREDGKGVPAVSLAEEIAAALGETEKGPRKTIVRVVELLGEERARTLLAETIEVEAAGGLQTTDGTQRRTRGGTFFKLVKDQTTSRERATIFRKPRPAAAPAPKPEPLSWEEVARISTEALQGVKGECSVKMTLIGRPGRVIEKGEVVITSLQSSSVPSLPKGLPQPPGDPSIYIVYIALKQWRRVRESIQKNPDDKLIIEGYPAFDRRIGPNGTMTVYAQSVTSKHLEQAKREKQRQDV